MNKRVLGVDEAGRGPVLGPMVMAACIIDEEESNSLSAMGVKDSKLLTKKQRENLFEPVKKRTQYEIIIVPPTEVDKAVSSKRDSLNLLEARSTATIINKLIKKYGDVDEIILDCPSTNTKKYAETMSSLLDTKANIVSEHKADLNYPVVAAASILAKVVRDQEMLRVSELAGQDIGSGYITDPKTYSWVQENYGKDYGFIRRSWATIKNLHDKKAQKSLGDFEKKEATNTTKEFDKLLPFGFEYVTTKNQYEVVRMRGPENVPATIIKYTTGKLVVQGDEKTKMKANALLQTTNIE